MVIIKKHLIKITFPLSLALFMLCLNPVAHALEKIVGKVLVSSGSFYANNPAGEKRMLARGTPIFEKDTLITEKGKAQIALQDGALLTLGSKTEFKVNQYSTEPQQKSSYMALLKGSFRTLTGFIAKEAPEHYMVNTPVATIGVRGTHYQVTSPADCLTVGPSSPGCRFTVYRARGQDAQKVTVTIHDQVFLLDDLHQALLTEAGIPRYADVSELDDISGLDDLDIGDLGELSAEDEKLATELLSQLGENDLKELTSLLDALDTPTLATLLSEDTLGSFRISDL